METNTYDTPYSQVFDTVLQIINKLGWVIESRNPETGNIVVSTGFSLRSWGERITIQVSIVGSQTSVLVTSAPKAQLIDWGKGRENERLFVRELNELIRRS